MITTANIKLMLTNFIKAEYASKYGDRLLGRKGVTIDETMRTVTVVYTISYVQTTSTEDLDEVMRRFTAHGIATEWFDRQVCKNFLGTYMTLCFWHATNIMYGLESGLVDTYYDTVYQLLDLLIGRSATECIVSASRDIISDRLPSAADRYADRMQTDWFGAIDNYSGFDYIYTSMRNRIMLNNSTAFRKYVSAVIVAAYAKRLKMISAKMFHESYFDTSFAYFCITILRKTCGALLPGHRSYCSDIVDQFAEAKSENDINILIKSLLAGTPIEECTKYLIDSKFFKSNAMKNMVQYLQYLNN